MTLSNPTTALDLTSGRSAVEEVDASYPRARLWLGIIAVGFMVTLCVLGLALDAGRWLDGVAANSDSGTVTALGWFVGAVLLASAPFDIIGGWILPRAHGRPSVRLGEFVVGLLRGGLLHAAFLYASGWALLQGLKVGGWFAALAIIAFAMVALVAAQRLVARLVGGVREDLDWAPTLTRTSTLLDSTEPGFAGGITGLPGFERIDLPVRWKREWPAAQLQLVLERRRYAIQSGLYRKGLSLAFAWNLVGAVMAAWIIGHPEGRVGEIVTFSFLVTLWNFAGLLILPTASRNCVLRMDKKMLEEGHAPEELAWLAKDCARLQDGEVSRDRRVETIFHPVPSLTGRFNGLAAPASSFAGWNASRQMLYLSWPLLGLVSRAVHGNVGRPALWVMPPAD